MATYKELIEECLSIGKNPKKAVKYLCENGFELDLNAYVAMRELHNQRKSVKWTANHFGNLELKLRIYKRDKQERTERVKEWAVRSDLLLGARVARKLGMEVKSSKFDGRISSYYIFHKGRKYRISDHDIPLNAKRETMGTQLHADIYASNSKIHREKWWERAIILMTNGREVGQIR